MQVQTLSELRAQEADSEEVKVEQAIEAKPEAEADAEVEQVEPIEGEVETEESASEEDGKPEWAKTEGQAVPVAKFVDLKHKLKAVREESQSEIEKLRQENEALRRGSVQINTVQAPELKPPTLADCDYDETLFAEKNDEYFKALIESKLSSYAQRTQSAQGAQSAQQALKQEVDKHYERASEFVTKKVVSEENYRNADARVRRAIQSIYPKDDGDAITDELIANIGEGSEKVLYHLGANPAALAKLDSLLRANPSGLKASAYLGELKARFEAVPINKLSSAPKPDVSLKGNVSLTVKSKQADYDKALNAGDVTMARTIKKAAQAVGADTSNW